MLLPITSGGAARSISEVPNPKWDEKRLYQRYTVGMIDSTDPAAPSGQTQLQCTANIVASGGQDLVVTAAHYVT
jgi:hypothetical protein